MLSLLVDGVVDSVRNAFGSVYRTVAGSLFIVRQIVAAAVLAAIIVALVQMARDAGIFDRSEPI